MKKLLLTAAISAALLPTTSHAGILKDIKKDPAVRADVKEIRQDRKDHNRKELRKDVRKTARDVAKVVRSHRKN